MSWTLNDYSNPLGTLEKQRKREAYYKEGEITKH